MTLFHTTSKYHRKCLILIFLQNVAKLHGSSAHFFQLFGVPLRRIFTPLKVTPLREHQVLVAFSRYNCCTIEMLRNTLYLLVFFLPYWIATWLPPTCSSISSPWPNKGDLEDSSTQPPWELHFSYLDAFPNYSQYLHYILWIQHFS